MGEILTGNKIESTRYQINMNENVTCNILCHQEFDQQHIKDITHLIEESYSVNRIVDNLPGAVSLPAEEGEGNLGTAQHASCPHTRFTRRSTYSIHTPGLHAGPHTRLQSICVSLCSLTMYCRTCTFYGNVHS